MEHNSDLLVKRLRDLPNETLWVEFKHNNYDPEMIGEDISALANGATLSDRKYTYMICGIADENHEVLGTARNLQTIKKGDEDLEPWLRRMLSNNAVFMFKQIEIDGKSVGILSIQKAIKIPVTFQKVPYIRSGSQTKKLADVVSLQEKI